MKGQSEATVDFDFTNSYLLEDEIYRQLDKIEALTALNTLLNRAETPPARSQLLHYCMTLEEQMVRMRELIDRLFIHTTV